MKHALLILALLAAPALAWDDCPFGLVDDPAPGRCRLYIDSNQDAICDRSQKQPQPAEDSAASSSAENHTSGPSAGGGVKKPSAAKLSADQTSRALATVDSVKSSAPDDPKPSEPQPKPPKNRPGRQIWLMFAATALLAAATEWLTFTKKNLLFRLQSIWNWLLLVLFLLSAATGLYFIVFPTLGNPDLARNIYNWHVETGIAFTAVGIYHALRRFACMLRGLGACFRRS